MLDVALLGTGGTMPMKNRWLTSCMIRNAGQGVLIDCGEGIISLVMMEEC